MNTIFSLMGCVSYPISVTFGCLRSRLKHIEISFSQILPTNMHLAYDLMIAARLSAN